MSITHSLDKAKDSILFVTPRPENVMHSGQGMYLYDTDGNAYLDYIAGWAVNCLGHSPKAISNALQLQAQQLVNASPSFYNTPMLQYAERLTRIAGLDRAFFMSSGAEANEGAIKLARKFGATYKDGAYEIITTKHGFHGRTLATMSATGKQHWEDLYEPKPKGFLKAVFNDLDSIRALVSKNTCAIMLELIQGEGGVHVASQDYIQGLRELCDSENILLIFDEIQTGFGRTGTMFGFEHYGIKPDIMTLGKGIGAGFPLSAMLCTEALNIFEAGDQGGTYTGQPLAMAVGLAVLNELEKQKLLANCLAQSQYLVGRLRSMAQDFEISNIRGRGLLLAFDLEVSNAPDVVAACMQKGLLINATNAHSIRLMPPLIVTEEDNQKMLSILAEAIKTRP